jgi:hypothetical protein
MVTFERILVGYDISSRCEDDGLVIIGSVIDLLGVEK